MNIAPAVEELEPRPRAVAIGSFDGVHLGHQRVLRTALDADLTSTVVTFFPHPRTVLGNEVELLTTLDRRLELLAELGFADALVVEFTPELSQQAADFFVEEVLRPIGTRIIAAGTGFRFGHQRRGDLELLRSRGFDVRPVPLVEGISSTHVRQLLRGGEVERAGILLGRPHELEGVVVAGDARGGTLGYPTANLRVEPDLLVPAYGIYAGAADGNRAAVSIGVNPHYGGAERRIEAFLLDFEGDLYGRQVRLELWQRLREERAFESERELVEQIGRDVEDARRAVRPT